MAIYTTYLGFLNKHKNAAEKVGSCFVFYIMRGRGNDEVAPSEASLKLFLARRKEEGDSEKLWQEYKDDYLAKIRLSVAAKKWMRQRALDAKIGNILLVCFEKDVHHCHRRLLAEEMQKHYHVEYKGELKE